jgi:hypothetical protein
MMFVRAVFFALACSIGGSALLDGAFVSGATAQSADHSAARQRIRDLDSGLAHWNSYLRGLPDRREPNAYASDPTYRAEFDGWMARETATAKAYLQQLETERAALVAWLNQNPVPVGNCDPTQPSFCGLELSNPRR